MMSIAILPAIQVGTPRCYTLPKVDGERERS
jgi:hypothetical protein